MHKDRLEYWGSQVVGSLERYVGRDGNSVSGAKVEALCGLSHVDAYAVKAWVEDNLASVKKAIEEEDGTVIHSYQGIIDYQKKLLSQAEPKQA